MVGRSSARHGSLVLLLTAVGCSARKVEPPTLAPGEAAVMVENRSSGHAVVWMHHSRGHDRLGDVPPRTDQYIVFRPVRDSRLTIAAYPLPFVCDFRQVYAPEAGRPFVLTIPPETKWPEPRATGSDGRRESRQDCDRGDVDALLGR